MTAVTFFACAMGAFAPGLSIFFSYTAKSAQLVIISLSSAFFWLLSALVSSAIWLGIVQTLDDSLPLTIFYSVLIQELFRLMYIKLLLRAEDGLHYAAEQPNSPYNRINYSFSAGLGYGLISAAVNYVSPLTSSWTNGNLFLPSCPKVSLFYLTAISTSISTLLQIVWMIIAVDGVTGRSVGKLIWVVGGHFVCSYATLLNAYPVNNGCVGAILLPLCYLIASAWICLKIAFKVKASIVHSSAQQLNEKSQ